MITGDLQGFIMKERPLSEERTWGFARDIARGMAYLHHKNILHRFFFFFSSFFLFACFFVFIF